MIKEGSQGILTKTLGDLYLKQGLKTKARRIYQQLLEMNPGDEELRERIQMTYLLDKSNAVPAPIPKPAWMSSRMDRERAEKVIKVLRKWLEKLNA